MKRIINLTVISLLICCCLSMTGCNSQIITKNKAEDKSFEKKEIEALIDNVNALGAWSVYWDFQGNEKLIKNDLNSISLFEAYFKEDKIFVPEQVNEMLDDFGGIHSEKYLCFVNDVDINGTITHKDTKILEKIFSDEATMNQYADEMMQIVNAYNLDGIELDYEKIRDDLNLWEKYFRFIELLKEKAGKEFEIRVILEANTPVEKLSFPSSVSYAVMCYNLYGYNEQEGPKADYSFLETIYNRFHELPSISYALANGGYEWTNSIPSQIKRADIESISKSHASITKRDGNSSAMTFSFKDAEGSHIIWYADEQTLVDWVKKLNELNGEKVSVLYWRM